ncbi:MAG: hypothetical protein AUK47_12470 [Deltaproteobacteria bacterium CG2_30_63_29]|nr:MAG: hypothetical protein AUK47_12470 [Deltaproteobacteria bacterium CG2_30_63_29]PJB39039.1 MAG: hypothetical protein CO108_18000 [Deltaproteobacteria bacterium CG_4_9_14_3_um_filter_63_12]
MSLPFAPPLPQGQRGAIRAALQAALEVLGEPAALWVIVNDSARATPTRQVLEVLRAQRAMPALHLVVACGSHTFGAAERQAHVEAQGIDVGQTVQWHVATDDFSIPNDAAVLAIGSVEPHWFAGYTGAHKTLTVGLWSRQRIERNHANALSLAASPAVLSGNPVHEDLVRQLNDWMAARRGPVAALNVVVDASQQVLAAVGGVPLQSLAGAVEVAERHFVVTLERPVDRLVARVGAPLSRSLYQALKGVKNHAAAVRKGGALVLVADCEDGVGIDHFMGLLRDCANGAEAAERLRLRGYKLGDHKSVRLLQLVEERGLQLGVVSRGLSDEDARVCRMTPFADLDAALEWARQVAPGAEELVVEDAGNRVTRVR